MKVNVIINTIRPTSAEVLEFIDQCRSSQKTTHVLVSFTEYAGHASSLAYEAGINGFDILIAVGGDGTFNEVINGMMDSGNRNIRLALIPHGTGNDFCRAQNIKFAVEGLIAMIEDAKYTRIDIGKLTTQDQTRYFYNIADAGFGGYTTLLLNQQRVKGWKGGISYTFAILRAFLTFNNLDVEVRLDDTIIYRGTVMMVACCNSSTFGNGLVVHPGADPSDGYLNLTLLGNINLPDYLLNIRNLRRGRFIKHPAVSYHQGRSVSVRLIKGHMPLETDGEAAGSGSATFEILPSAIPLVNYRPDRH